MKTITTVVAFAALLASAPSFAEDAKTETKERARVEKQEAPRRLSTVDRWRGAPYARSGSYNDALIRQEALDKTLPEISTTANFATTPSF